MGSPYFFAGSESALRAMIHHRHPASLYRQLRRAACRGMDPDVFHPDEGQPDSLIIARCTGCPIRLECLALAFRAEDPDMRQGWYGGLGPDDREGIAADLGLETTEPPVPDRAVQAARLRAAGWTVEDIATELGCSRRTVQRALRIAVA